MICKFCGNVIDDNSDFCFICGQKNPAEETPAPAPAEAQGEPVYRRGGVLVRRIK